MENGTGFGRHEMAVSRGFSAPPRVRQRIESLDGQRRHNYDPSEPKFKSVTIKFFNDKPSMVAAPQFGQLNATQFVDYNRLSQVQGQFNILTESPDLGRGHRVQQALVDVAWATGVYTEANHFVLNKAVSGFEANPADMIELGQTTVG